MNLAIRGIDSSNVKWNNEGSFLNDAHKDLKADFIIELISSGDGFNFRLTGAQGEHHRERHRGAVLHAQDIDLAQAQVRSEVGQGFRCELCGVGYVDVAVGGVVVGLVAAAKVVGVGGEDGLDDECQFAVEGGADLGGAVSLPGIATGAATPRTIAGSGATPSR